MLSFVVVTTEGQRPIPASTMASLRRALDTGSLDADVRHPVADRYLWSSDASTAAVLGWCSGWDPYGSGPPWTDHDGLTAFSGRLWPRGVGWSTRASWARQLADRMDSDGRGRSDLSGQYCLVRMSSKGSGVVCTDDVGVRSSYHGAVGGVHVIGTSARLVAAVLAGHDDPPRDPVAVGWLAYSGVLLEDERTGYLDVRRVPHGAHLRIDETGTRVVAGPSPFDVEPHQDRPVADAIEALAEMLQAELSVVSRLSGQPVSVGLTGGKDSRTVLAGALLAGVADDFTYYTFGRSDLPDQVVAAQLRERYGLRAHVPQRRPDEVRKRWQPTGDGSRLDRILRSVFLSSGALSVGTMEGVSVPAPRLSITGVGGEVLSTNYPPTSDATEPDDLYTFLYGGLKAGATGFIRPELLEHYDRSTDELAADLLDQSADVREAVDRFYLRVRMNRFFGMVDEWEPLNQVRPILNSAVIGVARSIGSAARRSEVLEYGLMRLADPELPHLPFAQDAWHATLPHHYHEGEVPAAVVGGAAPPRQRTSSRLGRITHPIEPAEASRPAKSTVAGERRAAFEAEHAAIFEQYLRDDPSNPLFDVVDYEAIVDAIARYPDISSVHERHLFGALTGAVWLGRHEQPPFD